MGLHFSKEEFSTRKTKVIQLMKEQNIDALLMFRQESMYWLTGYDTFGYVFFQSLVLDQKGNIILLTRAPDLRQAENTSNIENIRIWIDKDGSNPTNDLKEILNELNLKGKNLGVEYDAYGLTGKNTLMLNKSLKNYCSVEDKSELISKLRVIKSKEEIVYVKKAAELADNALDQVWKYAKAGVSESKILAEMNKVIFEGGGDYPANEFIIGSGPSALLVRYHAGKRHLDKDDQLTLEFSGAYMHYHAAMMRTLLVGKANPEHVSMHQICRDALEACMSAVKPGESMGTVYSEHSKVMDNAGYHEHRMRACGYGMGAVYNPLWVDPPMFYEGNPLEMKVGHVYFLHMILANSDRNLAMTLGQSVLVTDTGCENLSRSPLDLVINR